MERTLLAAIQSLLSGFSNLGGNSDWIQMWNNQLERMMGEENELYSINFPAIFLEIVSPINRQSLGNGVQLADFNFNLHIIHRQDDAGDGTVDQNLDVFDLKANIYKAIYLQWVDGFGQFGYVEETQDHNHANVYHFIQTYTTNWVDNSMTQPVGGIQTTPPTTVDLGDVVIDNNPTDY